MGAFSSLTKLRLGKKFGIIEGINLKEFNPAKATVGVTKASGGIVYFNILGSRIKADTTALDALAEHVDRFGQVRIVTSDATDLFEGAVAGPIIPWKGMSIQEFALKNGTVGYTVVEPIDA